MIDGSADMHFKIKLVFSDELVCFLQKKPKSNEVFCKIDRKRSIKDIIESKGVPHTEAGRIIVNGKDVDFHYIPEGPQTIGVVHAIPPFDVTAPTVLRPSPFPEIRFIVDVNVGKLAQLLRIIGINTLYSNSYSDREVADLAETDKRIVLTKDRGLLKRTKVVFGRHIRSINPYDQLTEVIGFYGLKGPFTLFAICLQCNVPLCHVEKQQILHRLRPKTKKYYSLFFSCPKCEKIYWKGTHHDHIAKRLISLGVNMAEAQRPFFT